MKMTSGRRHLWAPAVAALFAAVCMTSASTEAAVILQQAPTLTGGGATSDTASTRSFEDFRLGAAATITDLQWWGSVTNIPGEYEPLLGPISFTISFYVDGPSGFLPVASPFSQQVVSATGAIAAPDFGVSHFAAHLDTPVDLPSDTDLWISIVGHDLKGGHPLATPFIWGAASGDAPGAPTPGLIASQIGDQSPFLQAVQLSFLLESNPVAVPEPGTLSLLGVGIAALGLQRRRARRRSQ